MDVYVRKTTICNCKGSLLAIGSLNNPIRKENIPNLYLLGVFKILLAKYCEAKALDLGNRSMALRRIEEKAKRAIRIGA
jgi:hypothetical protein